MNPDDLLFYSLEKVRDDLIKEINIIKEFLRNNCFGRFVEETEDISFPQNQDECIEKRKKLKALKIRLKENEEIYLPWKNAREKGI